ncbi:hypothetical protein PSP6_280067 [Paraburkholderia tropica]|nr:hypothetical protein PSP6_280067 [Paraburkholderia tropica]
MSATRHASHPRRRTRHTSWFSKVRFWTLLFIVSICHEKIRFTGANHLIDCKQANRWKKIVSARSPRPCFRALRA